MKKLISLLALTLIALYPMVSYGEDDLEPPKNTEIWQPPAIKR